MGWLGPVLVRGIAIALVSSITRQGRRVRRFPWVAASAGWTYDALRTELRPGEAWAKPEVGAWVQRHVFSGEVDGGPFLTYECDSRQQGAVTAQGMGLHYVMVLVPTPMSRPA